MLHNQRTAEQYEALPEDIKKEYKKIGDAYILQHDEDTGALKRARDREKRRADEAEETLGSVEGERDKLKKDLAKVGDPEKIKADALKDVQPKLDRAARLEQTLQSSELDRVAGEMAKKIGGDKNKVALLPHVASKLGVKMGDDDKPVVFVKGADGKESATKLDELEQTVRKDANLASLVIVSQATGGAGQPRTQQQQQGPGVPQFPAGGTGEKTFAQLNAAERLQLHRTDPDRFRELSNATRAEHVPQRLA